MNIGLCECPIGLSKGQCKHKHVLANHFHVPSLDTIPANSPDMRAFYHHLGTGSKQNVTWYRPLNLPDTPLPTEIVQNSGVIVSHNNGVDDDEDYDSIHEGDVDNELVATAAPESAESDEMIDAITIFEDSINMFTKHVIHHLKSDPTNYSKAIIAFSRQCDALTQGNDAAIQKALHTFGNENTFSIKKGRRGGGEREEKE